MRAKSRCYGGELAKPAFKKSTTGQSPDRHLVVDRLKGTQIARVLDGQIRNGRRSGILNFHPGKCLRFPHDFDSGICGPGDRTRAPVQGIDSSPCRDRRDQNATQAKVFREIAICLACSQTPPSVSRFWFIRLPRVSWEIADTARAARMAMMATTTNSSPRLNARGGRGYDLFKGVGLKCQPR